MIHFIYIFPKQIRRRSQGSRKLWCLSVAQLLLFAIVFSDCELHATRAKQVWTFHSLMKNDNAYINTMKHDCTVNAQSSIEAIQKIILAYVFAYWCGSLRCGSLRLGIAPQTCGLDRPCKIDNLCCKQNNKSWIPEKTQNMLASSCRLCNFMINSDCRVGNSRYDLTYKLPSLCFSVLCILSYWQKAASRQYFSSAVTFVCFAGIKYNLLLLLLFN